MESIGLTSGDQLEYCTIENLRIIQFAVAIDANCNVVAKTSDHIIRKECLAMLTVYCSPNGVDAQQYSLGILACKSIPTIPIPHFTKLYKSKTDFMYQ